MKVAALLVACACAAACGTSPVESPANATPAAVPAPAPAAIPSVGTVPAGDASAQHVLKILVSPSRTYFDKSKDGVRGRAVDAGIALGKTLQRPVVFIDTPEDKLIPDLLAGKADIAANLLLTFERDDQVAFAKPVREHIRELVVTGAKQRPLVSLEDVAGRAIHVRRSSDHHASLERLNAQLKAVNHPGARIVITPGTDEDLLEMVNAGKIPATIVDDYIFDLWKPQFPNIAANRDVAVSQDGILAWVTRKSDTELLARLNEFFASHRLTF